MGEDNLDQVFMRLDNPRLERAFHTEPAYLRYPDSFREMARLTGAEAVSTYKSTGGSILFGEGIEFVPFGASLCETD